MTSLFKRIANEVKQSISVPVDPDYRLPPGMSEAAKGRLSASPLMGGLSMDEVKRIYDRMRGTDYARKNLWLLSITDVSPLNLANSAFDSIGSLAEGGFSVDSALALGSLVASFSRYSRRCDFNLFATDLSYSPVHVAYEAHRINGASFAAITGSELKEVRFTTLDDAVGTIKKWAKLKAALASMPNGAIGLPNTYLLNVKITHAFASEHADNAENAYKDEYVMFISGCETELSRREDGLQELQITLTQFDTFTKLV